MVEPLRVGQGSPRFSALVLGSTYHFFSYAWKWSKMKKEMYITYRYSVYNERVEYLKTIGKYETGGS